MNLSQLRYFQVVAEEEHISRAAEKLHISQPSLSTTIRRLEAELDTPLFERRGRNIYLNDAGRRLLKHINYIIEQIQTLEKDIERTKFDLDNKVSLAVNNSMFLDGWIVNFIVNNKDIRLSQTMLSEEQMIESLRNEKIDLALGFFSDVPDDLEEHVLLQDEYMVALPKNHPLAQKNVLYFDDIRDEPFSALPSNAIDCFIHQQFAQKNAVPNIIFEGQHRMMMKLLLQGHALLFTSRQITHLQSTHTHSFMNIEYGHTPAELVVMPIIGLNTNFNLSICRKKDRPLPIMAEKLFSALITDYKKNASEALQTTTPSIKISFRGGVS